METNLIKEKGMTGCSLRSKATMEQKVLWKSLFCGMKPGMIFFKSDGVGIPYFLSGWDCAGLTTAYKTIFYHSLLNNRWWDGKKYGITASYYDLVFRGIF